jgi:hypothetical protein
MAGEIRWFFCGKNTQIPTPKPNTKPTSQAPSQKTTSARQRSPLDHKYRPGTQTLLAVGVT